MIDRRFGGGSGKPGTAAPAPASGTPTSEPGGLNYGESISRHGYTITGQKTPAQIQQEEEARQAGRPLPPASADDIKLARNAEAQWDTVAENFDPSFVGPGKGSLVGLRRMLPADFPVAGLESRQVNFYQAIKSGTDLLVRERSGAQVNNDERRDIRDIVPKELDSPDTFTAALAYTQTEATRLREETEILALSARSRIPQLLAEIRAQRSIRHTAALKDLRARRGEKPSYRHISSEPAP